MVDNIIYAYTIARYVGDEKTTCDCFSSIKLSDEDVACVVGFDPYDPDATYIVSYLMITPDDYYQAGGTVNDLITSREDVEYMYLKHQSGDEEDE